MGVIIEFDLGKNKPDFEKTFFYKYLLKQTNKLFPDPRLNQPQSQRQEYKKAILETCIRISSQISLLKISKTILREKQLKNTHYPKSITNGEFIRYHLEAYFFRITTIRDLILKLINRVHNFKLPENLSLESTLLKKAKNENNNKL